MLGGFGMALAMAKRKDPVFFFKVKNLKYVYITYNYVSLM